MQAGIKDASVNAFECRRAHTRLLGPVSHNLQACDAQLGSPGAYGTQGSNRPGVST